MTNRAERVPSIPLLWRARSLEVIPRQWQPFPAHGLGSASPVDERSGQFIQSLESIARWFILFRPQETAARPDASNCTLSLRMNSPQITESTVPDLDELFSLSNRLIEHIALVVLGKPEVIKLAVVALLAEGHVLIEDVPGVGKTLLARAIAASIDCSFRRIQFTPDLLPSDVLGSSIYHAPSGEFVFKPGPLFANVILADEINRTTPRTQSALLEAMSDRQASIEGHTYPLAPPFIVLATQNPYEFEGTYVLPESQLDRFMLRLRMGYPIRAEERRVVASHRDGEPVDSLGAVLSTEDVLQLQRGVRTIQVDDAITDYLLDIVHSTRRSDDLHVGVSTRGALTLYRAAQSLALVSGRGFVIPDDVKVLAVSVLAHRVVGKSFLQAGEFGASEAIIRDIVDRIRVPS
jgi:MoxR-like ATPase